MNPEPCSVCGGTDLNLIDGFYYCVECGTQDTNAQETVVEHTMLADGTFAHAATRKITKVLKDAIEMSGEWHKWHAFNFILIGLVEELMTLGASIRFRDRVLWIWTRYMIEFMDRTQMGTIMEIKEKEGLVQHKSLFEFEDDEEEIIKNTNKDKTKKISKQTEKEKMRLEKDRNSIKEVTKTLLLSIIYIALNLAKSEIQLSHLCRFIREGRISFAKCQKFVPSELDLKSIPHWKAFMNSGTHHVVQSNIREVAMTLVKVLDLGKLLVPDIRKMVDSYVKELCLPDELRNLVFSLLHQVPCNFLDIDRKFAVKILVRIPDFEGVIMSYVLVALKMTFGLDDNHEIALSNAVDKINDEENRIKSYGLGLYSNPTDRMFSFREWSNFLQFRKALLCKYYLPMAQQHNLDVDDHVFIEHLEERAKRKVLLSEEVTMDILNKIIPTEETSVIPKSEFAATLTPMANYTEVILHYIQDPEVKILISEDFTRYSLKYACEDLKLLNGEENIITGVSKENKFINKVIVGNLISTESDLSMVYVRNCENQNWLKTKPPTADHITKIDAISDRESDHGYDSNLESNSVDINITQTVSEGEDDNERKQMETIEEEMEGISIFDDLFDNIDTEEEKNHVVDTESYNLQSNNDTFENNELDNDIGITLNDESNIREVKFDPATFEREKTIMELVLGACKKHKIPVPKEYDTRAPRKRRSDFVNDGKGAKRKKNEPGSKGDAQKALDNIMTAYYANVEKDLLEKVSEHLKSVVKDFIDEADNLDENIPDVPNFDESFNNDENRDNNIQLDNENENKTMDEMNNKDKTLDSIIMEGEETNGNLLMPKLDPKFDAKTHDVKQLFVKYSQNLSFESLIAIEDPNIDKILEKKIEEFSRNEPMSTSAQELYSQLLIEESGDDSDEELDSDDEFLIDLKRRLEKMDPLIENEEEEFKEFNYWLRHYSSICMRKNLDLKEKFDLELKENFPKSFSFVIQECAAILDCTAFSLYKHMQNLEHALFM